MSKYFTHSLYREHKIMPSYIKGLQVLGTKSPRSHTRDLLLDPTGGFPTPNRLTSRPLTWNREYNPAMGSDLNAKVGCPRVGGSLCVKLKPEGSEMLKMFKMSGAVPPPAWSIYGWASENFRHWCLCKRDFGNIAMLMPMNVLTT